jgi:Protein of unknown function (DUF2815)
MVKMALFKVQIENATLSYPSLFEPGKTLSGEDKFMATFAVDAKSPDAQRIRQAILQAATERWGPKAEAELANGQLWNPLRRSKEKPNAGYKPGTVFISAKSDSKPGVVSKYAGADGKPLPIVDPTQVYAGCRVAAFIFLFGFDRQGKRGVSALLGNVQVLDNDPSRCPRLDGRLRAEDEFAALEETPADFDSGDVDDDPMAA